MAFSDGQPNAAVAACLPTSSPTVKRLNGPPWRVGEQRIVGSAAPFGDPLMQQSSNFACRNYSADLPHDRRGGLIIDV